MAKRKNILNSALKALLAGVETSVWVKIPATFIAEIASLPENTRDALNTASMERFNELLAQMELSAANIALTTAGTEQIKKLVSKLTQLSTEQLDALKTLTQQQYQETFSELHAIHADTEEIKGGVKKLLAQQFESRISFYIEPEIIDEQANQIPLPPKGLESNINRNEVRSIAKKIGLFKLTNANPQLAFEEGDISYFWERGLTRAHLEAELRARKLILDRADKAGIVIPQPGDLSEKAKPLILSLLNKWKENSLRLKHPT